jgi:NADH:ubiquinone oxidoreductase subunit C
VETGELIDQLGKAVPGAVLEVRPFGAQAEPSVWIESAKLAAAGEYLRTRDPALDWLEDLTVFQLDQSLILSYFLRSHSSEERLVLRVSLAVTGSDAWLAAPSVIDIWPEARAFESDSGELFGIQFGGKKPEFRILPDDWEGFPLRKNYIFPADHRGIPHMRPVGRTVPDEFEVTQ